MKISDIDFDVLKDLVTSVPSNMELLSIEFPDGNIRLHFVVDLSIIAKDRYNSSLQGLLSLLDGFD